MTTITSGGTNTIPINLGGGILRLTIQKTTNSTGTADFILPVRRYNFRIDEDGQQHWSSLIDVVPGQMNEFSIDLN